MAYRVVLTDYSLWSTTLYMPTSQWISGDLKLCTINSCPTITCSHFEHPLYLLTFVNYKKGFVFPLFNPPSPPSQEVLFLRKMDATFGMEITRGLHHLLHWKSAPKNKDTQRMSSGFKNNVPILSQNL